MCSGTEAGSYVRLTDSCITQLKAQGPSRTCNVGKEEEGFTNVHVVLVGLHETRGLLDGVRDIRALLREHFVAVQHLLAHREILHSRRAQGSGFRV